MMRQAATCLEACKQDVAQLISAPIDLMHENRIGRASQQ